MSGDCRYCEKMMLNHGHTPSSDTQVMLVAGELSPVYSGSSSLCTDLFLNINPLHPADNPLLGRQTHGLLLYPLSIS